MRHAAFLLIALSLVACKKDKDNDGFTSDVDCNDNNADVNPGATELCNSIDDDCDGTVDNNAGDQWFLDADNDGAGESEVSVFNCNQPTGYVASADDCNDGDDRFYPGAPEDDCADPNDYNCDGSVGYADADADGFAACEECNDSNAEINPSAEEVCDGADNDCDTLVDADDPDVTDASTWYIDYDGDGYGADTYVLLDCSQPDGFVASGDDCDDARSESYPGAPEICDGYDNNCDGSIDEDAGDLNSYFLDSDGDGYGDADSELIACDIPAGYIDNGGDCDDSNVDISPDADEVCDGVDNDCDTLIDDDDADTLHDSSDLHYLDSDDDGYGTYTDFVLTCDTPTGYIDTAGDCDDADSAVNPDATESCDGIDNNCVDGIDEDTATDALTWYIDADGDDYGLADSTTLACAQPTGYAPVGDDCDDGDVAVNPDAAEVCNNGIDDDCDGGYQACALGLADADVILTGEASLDGAAVSIRSLGDIDGDGYDDVIIGARDNDTAGTDAGAAYVFMGPVSSGTIAGLDTADTVLRGEDASDRFGRDIAGGFDVDDDGINDIIVSSPSDETGGSATGSVYVFSGADVLGGGSMTPTDATASWLGEEIYDYLGVAVGLADLTGDGVADIIAAANGSDAGGSSTGAIYVLAGPVGGAGQTDLGSGSGWAARVTGESDSDAIGQSFSTSGDIDGDGQTDLLVGVSKDSTMGSTSGAAYVVLGPLSGDSSLASADAKLIGDSESTEYGNSVSIQADQDGDGYDEVVVASHLDDLMGSDAGAVYLYSGTATVSSWDGGSATGLASATILGPTTSHKLGTAVRGGGDFDGDGTPDLLVAASGAGDVGQGTVYVYSGPVAGTLGIEDALASFVGETADDAAGAPVEFMGDVSGVGNDAIGIGAIANDRAGTDAGTFYMIYDVGL